VADAAEAIAAGAQMGFEHGLDATAKREVGVADDAGAMARFAVAAAGAHGRDTIHEFGFAYVSQFHRPARPEHGARLHKHGGNDIVAAAGVGHQLVEQVAPIRPIPEMMVGIDDGQIGLEDGLVAAGKPNLGAPADNSPRAWRQLQRWTFAGHSLRFATTTAGSGLWPASGANQGNPKQRANLNANQVEVRVRGKHGCRPRQGGFVQRGL